MEIISLLIGVTVGVIGIYYAISSNKKTKEIEETLNNFITNKSKYLKEIVILYSNSKERIYALTTAWNVNDDLRKCFTNSNVKEVVFCGPIDLPTIGRVLWRNVIIKKRLKRQDSSITVFHSDMNTIGMKFIIGDDSVLLSDSRSSIDGSSNGLLVPNATGPMLSFLESHYSNVLKNPRTDIGIFRIDHLIWSFIRYAHGIDKVNIDQVVNSLLNASIFSANSYEDFDLRDLFYSYIDEMVERGKLLKEKDNLLKCISPDHMELLEMNEYCDDCLMLETFEKRYPKWREILDKSELSFTTTSLAAVLYNLSKDYDKAIEAAKKAIQLCDGPDKVLAILYNNLGHALKESELSKLKVHNSGDVIVNVFSDVEMHFKKAIELDPDFLSAKKNIGILYFRIAEKIGTVEAEKYWAKSEKYLLAFAKASKGKFAAYYSLARYYGVRNMKREACDTIQDILDTPGHQFKEWFTSREFIVSKYKTDRDYYFSGVKKQIDNLLYESTHSISTVAR